MKLDDYLLLLKKIKINNTLSCVKLLFFNDLYQCVVI
jgi:hypothetical protein